MTENAVEAEVVANNLITIDSKPNVVKSLLTGTEIQFLVTVNIEKLIDGLNLDENIALNLGQQLINSLKSYGNLSNFVDPDHIIMSKYKRERDVLKGIK